MERKTTTTGTGTETITTDPTGDQKSFLTVLLFFALTEALSSFQFTNL